MGGEIVELDANPVRDLAESQLETYRRQPEELVSHFNREVSALDGYRGRQILELLQNADDAGGGQAAECKLQLDISRERLVVANTGTPFSRKGLISLVISDCSPKQLDRNRFIGCKGLGFRSVLTWTDRPLISSGSCEVVFDRERAIAEIGKLATHTAVNDVVSAFRHSTQRWPAAVMRFPAVPAQDDEWLEEARKFRSKGFVTAIVLPLRDGSRGDEIYSEIVGQLRELPASALLFCRHLTQVEITGAVNRKWELARQHVGDRRSDVVLEEDGVPQFWSVHWRSGQVSIAASGGSLSANRDYELAVAVPETPTRNDKGTLCVFFPTHERLPCSLVMHATLQTTDDRNRVVSDASNREVLDKLAEHVAETIEKEATAKAPRRALELLAGAENADPELRALGFVDALVKYCAVRRIFPTLGGKLSDSAGVFETPHAVWLSEATAEIFPEVLPIRPSEPLRGLLALFEIGWLEPQTLKDRLCQYLLGVAAGMAGEVVGRLLAAGQLGAMKVNGLLLGEDGRLIEEGECFFTPVEKLPVLPGWSSSVRFVDEAFQAGLLRGSAANGLRHLTSDLSRQGAHVEEYRFDTVARALINEADAAEEAAAMERWRQLLPWLFDASTNSRQVLPQLAIRVPTKGGVLRRATSCYMGADYPGGRLVGQLYAPFGKDEFVASQQDCGLAALKPEDAEAFLVAIGVGTSPRLVSFDSGADYRNYVTSAIDRASYPLVVRDRLCASAEDLRNWCTSCAIFGVRLPDRWIEILTEGDAAAIAALLLSSGAPYLTDERDPNGKFHAMVQTERAYRPDGAVPVPNAILHLLREVPWIPVVEGGRRRPSEVMLSTQGAKVLRGVYARHGVDPRDELIAAHGGRRTLESLLTRLGAVTSLETLNGPSLYEMLITLPERDPSGEIAKGIYRTLVESSVTAEDSAERDAFLKAGRMWGRYRDKDEYLPVSQLRYNASLSVTKAIEGHVALVHIPRRKNTHVVRQLFGIAPLTSEEISLELKSDGTEFDPGSEDANLHLKSAISYIYALRLENTLDERGKDRSLLTKAILRVCKKAVVIARLPGDINETITLDKPGERIVIGTTLVVIGDYRDNGPGFLTFWLSVAELVAELLGMDIAGEVGGILRCRTASEMLEVLRVRLGSATEQRLSEARERLKESTEEVDDIEYPLPAPAQPSSPGPKAGGSVPTPPAPQPAAVPAGGAFTPVSGPVAGPTKKRRLVIAGAPTRVGGGGGAPLATEEVTFKVVEAFEAQERRFTVPVSHLRGSEAFGCDLLSVGSAEIKDKALESRTISDSDIERYIEVKGRSSRTGEVELSDNEMNAAKRLGPRFWLYRVFVDPTEPLRYEVALLRDPLSSGAVRTSLRFNLAEGSGAAWYAMAEVTEQPAG